METVRANQSSELTVDGFEWDGPLRMELAMALTADAKARTVDKLPDFTR